MPMNTPMSDAPMRQAAEPQTPWTRSAVMARLDAAMTEAVECNFQQRFEREHAVEAVDVHISFMRAVTGQTEATAKVVGGGKTLVFCEAQWLDPQGQVLAQALGTYRVRPR
jgi:acyl-coenzyme A thioesterase PaaI-like protein